MSGRVWLSRVSDLSPWMYDHLRQMNLRGGGNMQHRLALTRRGWGHDYSARASLYTRVHGEVALWVEDCTVRSVALWTRYAAYDQTIDVYTPARYRRHGYGEAVLHALHLRHPDAMTFGGWTRDRVRQWRKRRHHASR